MHHKWDEIVALANKGRFGDILIKGEGEQNRGPVQKAYCRGPYIVFETIWMAGSKDGHKWNKLRGNELTLGREIEASFHADGTLQFVMPGIGEVKLFQKHTEHLESTKVHGLSSDDVRRFRAWEYDLPLDSSWETIVQRVVHELGADGLVDGCDQLQVQEEAAGYA